MRGTYVDHAISEVEEEIEQAFPKSDQIKETQLMKKLKPLLDKVTEEDLKIYSFGEGARSKIQLTQYPSICQNNRQIFERAKVFKTMSQLDALAHKIGSDTLHYLFITREKIPLTKRAKRFIERENERNFRGQLCLMQEEARELCDFLNKGIISESKFEHDLDALICDMETPEQMKIAAKVIDSMLEDGEISRSKNRLRQRKHRDFEAKYSNLQQVK